jgi:heterodisulfide reductase subunit A-like polyferredoxin
MDQQQAAKEHEANAAAGQAVGAVMVVGGGIAGMQASLDLAEAGFKVYLVEQKSAIGGHMAQLDKTFPTNDCAMCTISPKLVEVGRHRNIAILTNTEVLELAGTAGNFTARLGYTPRHIDSEKCTSCGDCAKVCPVTLPDGFNEGLSQRHAAFKLYPQATPNAYAIEKRGIAPCRDACPAGQRAQGYIALIREGRYADALRTIKEDNPFPAICGRVCNHRCEEACSRGKVDEPLNIHSLKRFVTDTVYAQPCVAPASIEHKFAERVAIVGAGPCGLTAARDLCQLGYPVTVFESLPVAGGMLRVGIPEFRLQAETIDREVQDILDLGVELKLNHKVAQLDDLFAQGFKSVLVAVGAHDGVRLPVPGADLRGVMLNTDFLREVRLDRPPDFTGKRVMVLGGGNVAVDVARTAARLGAAEVHMTFLETRQTMPAHPWEVEATEAEGVKLHPARSFKRIMDDGQGGVAGLETLDVTFMEFQQGQLKLETAPGSERIIGCDIVIFSVGQRPELKLLEGSGVEVTRRRLAGVNPETLASARPGVFAAGDAVSGTSFVINAIADGHKCATSIHQYLRGEEVKPKVKPAIPVVEVSEAEINGKLAAKAIRLQARHNVHELPAAERLRSFVEVETGFTEEEAKAEASRCLSCGVCSECLSCSFECKAGAINHDDAPRIDEVKVGAVVLAPGYQAYNAELSEEFGWGRFPNVVTALQFERLLSASGPTMGHVVRPSDGKPAKKIAFLQCIGSRDQKHDYCSAVCCMYAAKEAIMAREHDSEVEITVFFMDTRAFSKGYSAYYRRAQERYNIHYERCRVSSIKEDPKNGDLMVRHVSRDSASSADRLHEEPFDMVVLSVGMEISPAVRELGRRLAIEMDDYGFCHTVAFQPLQTSKPGIYAVGPFREPKDIPETVVEASGAAAMAETLLAPARGTLITPAEYPPERDTSKEEPKVGVFVCHCGSNIGGFLDVPEVAKYAESLPHVVHAENNLYTCSQDSIKRITEQARELGLNRVVVASCTPLTHEPLFQDSIRQAGLNPYLFEMANIRNQCSWVHSHGREVATEKAKELVRMAVARAAELTPLHRLSVPVSKRALVIGGGVAGMETALSLAGQGIAVDLIEREAELGGNLRHLRFLVESVTPSGSGADVKWRDAQALLNDLLARVAAQPLITVHLQSELQETKGYKGNFTSIIKTPQGPITLNHGATIVAVGAREYRGTEYGLGADPRIMTQQDFEQVLADGATKHKSVVMIQCIGPGETNCTRTCCIVALKNAIKLKQQSPAAEVTVLYQDIRAYGFKERLYTEARRLGVLFIHYDAEHRPQVLPAEGDAFAHPLAVKVWEPELQREITLHPDCLVLSTPMTPAEGNAELANRLKVAVDLDGWLMEAHVKLRPVDFPTEGLYMAGAAHYPKLIDESIVQAQAAAARAATILTQDTLQVGGVVSEVNPDLCVGCLTCVRSCPYGVPQIKPDVDGVGRIHGAAFIEPAKCQGCGICASECPARAIELMHFRHVEIEAKVDALFDISAEALAASGRASAEV